jgi:16S rRNA (guanine966-N2)-methyltransferase
MRIVTGKHRGRRLATPADRNIRPTSDRIREAIFDILSHRLFAGRFDGAMVLDVFAGTGAMGCEALSRGAARATFLDSESAAIRLVEQNVRHLGEAENVLVLRRDATRPGKAPLPHDLVFTDPPYRSGLAPATLEALAQERWLAPGALVVLELASDETPEPPTGFTEIDQRRYGGTTVHFWRWGQPVSDARSVS